MSDNIIFDLITEISFKYLIEFYYIQIFVYHSDTDINTDTNRYNLEWNYAKRFFKIKKLKEKKNDLNKFIN